MYTACQSERLLSTRQGTLWVLPHHARALGLVPRRFRQRFLIVTGLGYLPGLLQQRLRLWLVEGLLDRQDRQDRQAVEGYADHPGQLLLLRISQQLFIGLRVLLPA